MICASSVVEVEEDYFLELGHLVQSDKIIAKGTTSKTS
jgi:hypothetical protein